MLWTGEHTERYEGTHPDTGETVVLEVLRPAYREDPDVVARMRLLLALRAYLAHPNLMPLADVIVGGDLGTLGKRLRGAAHAPHVEQVDLELAFVVGPQREGAAPRARGALDRLDAPLRHDARERGPVADDHRHVSDELGQVRPQVLELLVVVREPHRANCEREPSGARRIMRDHRVRRTEREPTGTDALAARSRPSCLGDAFSPTAIETRSVPHHRPRGSSSRSQVRSELTDHGTQSRSRACTSNAPASPMVCATYSSPLAPSWLTAAR